MNAAFVVVFSAGQHHYSQVNAVAIAPDGTWLATGSQDGTARIWDATTGTQKAALIGHHSHVNAVAIAPDGTWLATVGNDGTPRIWDATTGTLKATLTGHRRQVHGVAIAPEGTWLATGGADGTLRIWDAATGRAITMMRVDNAISACVWIGSHGLAVGGDAGLYLFDFLPGTP